MITTPEKREEGNYTHDMNDAQVLLARMRGADFLRGEHLELVVLRESVFLCLDPLLQRGGLSSAS